MDENTDRAGVIELLEKLGDEDDAAVLAAARALHGRIGEMGLTWDELLVPDDDGESEETADFDDDDDDADADDADADDADADDADDETEDDDTDDETEDDDTEVSSEETILTGDTANDVKVIERLLARTGISEELREELTGYKEDIAEGDFTESDRNYLNSLQKRLSQGSKQKSGKRVKK